MNKLNKVKEDEYLFKIRAFASKGDIKNVRQLVEEAATYASSIDFLDELSKFDTLGRKEFAHDFTILKKIQEKTQSLFELAVKKSKTFSDFEDVEKISETHPKLDKKNYLNFGIIFYKKMLWARYHIKKCKTMSDLEKFEQEVLEAWRDNPSCTLDFRKQECDIIIDELCEKIRKLGCYDDLIEFRKNETQIAIRKINKICETYKTIPTDGLHQSIKNAEIKKIIKFINKSDYDQGLEDLGKRLYENDDIEIPEILEAYNKKEQILGIPIH